MKRTKMISIMSVVAWILGCVANTSLAATPNLVGWWSFDEGTGDVAADGSRNGHDGILVNTTWQPGQLGSALGFDGTAYVDVPPECWADISTQVTLAFWVYIPTADLNQSNFIVGAFSDPANNEARVFSAHLPWGGATVYYDTSGPGYDRTSKAISADELADAWNHWAFTKDADTGDVMIYRNGALWHSDVGKNKPLQGADVTRFTIGTKPSLAEGWFTGMIDDVQLYNAALSEEDILKAMQGITLEKAASPAPETEAVDVLRDSILTWKPGEFAGTHNLYLGTSLEDVNNATVPTAAGLDVNSFDPGRLAFGQTYYWRVDEVNGTPDKTVFKGEVWSFTAEPYSIKIPAAEIAVTASSSANEFSLPEKLVDGSGLAEDGTHNITPETMWFTASPDMDPWIQFEFEDVKQLDTMTVWNSNGAAESAIGWGVKDVVIEYSQDGENWSVLEGVNQISRAPGLPTYAAPDVIAFNGVPVKYVRLDINSNWGGILMSYSLSEVQFNMIPAQARTPDPASGATDIAPGATVTWRAGREAAEHTVYISTDVNAVADGTAPSVTTPTNSLDLGTLDLDLGDTYYWRVDEVNDAEETPVWAGPVWRLSIISAVVVDDFEGYGNASPDRPFQTWLDGFGYSPDEFFAVGYEGNGTGSGIGHDIWTLSSPHYDGDIMETTNVITGSSQSLPLYFDNAGGPSQTDRTFATPQDWTLGGATTLSIAVRGNATLSATNTLYAKINGTKVTYDGDLSVPIWRPWLVDLTALGINLSSVTTLSIGVEGSGSGMVLLDDILLHKTAPVINEPPAGSDRSLVGHWTLDETEGQDVADSSGYGNHGTLIGMDGSEWTTGHNGGALEITGASSTTPKYVRFENTTSLQLYDSATISAWVKMNAATADVYMGIAGKLVSGYYQGFALVRHSSNVFRLWCDDGAGVLAGFDASSDVTYTDTEWHHVAGVIDDGTSILYVDGVRQAKEGAVDLTDSGTYVQIGKQYSDESSHRYWNGLVDDVRIYYRALSEQEIQGL